MRFIGSIRLALGSWVPAASLNPLSLLLLQMAAWRLLLGVDTPCPSL